MFDEKRKSVLTGLNVVCVMNRCVMITCVCDFHHYIQKKITPIWGFSHWVDWHKGNKVYISCEQTPQPSDFGNYNINNQINEDVTPRSHYF